MDSTTLLYFDKDMDFQFYLSNEQPETCPYFDAPHKEALDFTNEFEVRIPANHPDTESIAEGGYIGFLDREEDFQLFKIVLIEEEDSSEQGLVRALFCRHVFEELADLPVEDKRPQNATAAEAIDRALELQTKWQRGNVAGLGLNSTNFYYESVMEALFDIQNTWGGEIKPRIEIDANNRVTGFYIDLYLRRGSDTGLRVEIDRNAKHIKRKYDEEGIKTAIYPRGKGQETGDGYTRRRTIADVEWSTANGDPVDKPLGQEWICDPEALHEHGIDDGNGNKIHRFGFVNFDEDEDPEVLIQKGWEALQELKNPRVQYEASIEALALEEEPIQLGDTVAVIDYNFVPAIAIKARVIELIHYKDTNEINIKLGNFMPAFSKQNEEILKKIDDLGGKTGAIEQGESGPITDDDFEDITPEAPQNVSATGLFKTISLKWDYDPSYNIAAYEVYGSQTAGFNPDSTTLLYRGKSGGYVHEVGASNQQWYYKVRAINPHGTAGPYSQEVSAQTIKINAKTDIQPLTITNELIAENAAIDFAKIANVEITNAMIANIDASKITTGTLDAARVRVGPATFFEDGYDPTKIDVGVRNLLKNSNSPIISNSKYGIGSYEFTVDLIAGETYTFTFNGRIDSTFKNDGGVLRGYIYEYTWSHGSFSIALDSTTDTTVKLTFTPSWTGRYVCGFYRYPSDVATSSSGYAYVNWGTVVKANKGTADWIPAHEDNPALLWQYGNTTYIDGGKIYANSITANQIAAGAITADKLATRSITADKLNVTSLSAISANLGTITAGTISGVTIQGSTIKGTGTTRVEMLNDTVRFYRSGSYMGQVTTADMYGSGEKMLHLIGTNSVYSVAGVAPESTTLGAGSSVYVGKNYSYIYARNKTSSSNTEAQLLVSTSEINIDYASAGGWANLRMGTDGTGGFVQSPTIYNRTYSSGANVYVTMYGTLGRNTSATKYKLAIEEVTDQLYFEKLLQLQPKSWYDKAATEAYADYLDRHNGSDEGIDESGLDIPYLQRYIGLIAEDLEALGLTNFLEYGPPDEFGNREIEGIAYDRLWVLTIPLIRELKQKIEQLEGKVA